jgi:hypothetical protein
MNKRAKQTATRIQMCGRLLSDSFVCELLLGAATWLGLAIGPFPTFGD